MTDWLQRQIFLRQRPKALRNERLSKNMEEQKVQRSLASNNANLHTAILFMKAEIGHSAFRFHPVNMNDDT